MEETFWDKLNATSRTYWFRTFSIGLGVLGIGLLIAIIGFLLLVKK